MRRDRDRVRERAGVEVQEEVRRRLVALVHRRRRIARDHPLVAEVLEDEQALVEIGVVDLGRREALLAQALRHRDIGQHIVGEMRDRAIGSPAPDRRAVSPPRRIHQDHRPVAEHEPVVAAGRGVPRQPLAHRHGQPARRDELAHRRDPLDPRREVAIAGDPRMAELKLHLGRQGQRHVEPIGGQETRRPVGPFEQHDRALRQVVEAKLGQLGCAREPVEVGMHQRELGQLVGLHQREGRARHLDRLVAGEVADEPARKRGLARPEIPRQRHQIAWLERAGDVDHQPLGRLLVRQHHREARPARCGQEHRHGRLFSLSPLAAISPQAAIPSPACGQGNRICVNKTGISLLLDSVCSNNDSSLFTHMRLPCACGGGSGRGLSPLAPSLRRPPPHPSPASGGGRRSRLARSDP